MNINIRIKLELDRVGYLFRKLEFKRLYSLIYFLLFYFILRSAQFS